MTARTRPITDSAVEALAAHGRALAAIGSDEAAKNAFLAALKLDPTHEAALLALARLALRTGHRSAARTALGQAILCHPRNAAARINLGELLLEAGDYADARAHFQAAVEAAPGLGPAHQGLARALTALGERDAATAAWRKAFERSALVPQPYCGAGPAVRVLLLVSSKGGNIPTQLLIDDTIFAVTALYADHHRPDAPLPAHDLVLNAVADADLCSAALQAARRIAASTAAPVINHPWCVARTGRAENARRLAQLPDVIAPAIRSLRREALLADPDLEFPLLLRAPGFHTGEHFERVARREDLEAQAAALPGETLLAIQALDARGADGLARKYRVMLIDGAAYPLHLAVSRHWKVHYFSGDMAGSAAHRAEEAAFLADMRKALGWRATAALASIGAALGLDYAGVDFALAPDGRLVLFEANAGMVIQPPGPEPMWDYRRAPIDRALTAARDMLLRKAAQRVPSVA